MSLALLANVLMACSSGDRDVAAAVYAAAVQANVDPALALAVACRESGVQGSNPMGVRACYAGVRDRPSEAKCIAIGVRSLKHRLRGCGGDELCAARRYNNAAGRVAYAAKVLRIVRFVRGKAK